MDETPKPSPVVRTIRFEVPGAVRSELLGGWIVPDDEMMRLVTANRVMRGLPPLVQEG